VIGLVLVLGLQVGMGIALETVRPDWRDPVYGTRRQALRTFQHRHAGQPLVLVFGSSRSEMAICPKACPELQIDGQPAAVFNFALPGNGPLHHLLNLRRLLAEGVRPHTALIELFPPALCLAAPAEAIFDGAHLAYADLEHLAPYCGNARPLWRQYRAAHASPVSLARFSLLSRCVPGWVPWERRVDYLWDLIDETGWMRYPRETIDAVEHARGMRHAEGYIPRLVDYHLAAGPERAVQELLRLCAEHQIRVALHYMPEGPVFRGWYPAHEPHLRQTLAVRWHAEWGVPTIDTTTWYTDEALFTDSHHLLPGPARAFTPRFVPVAVAAARVPDRCGRK
jgi:hypothetical protein